MQCTIFGCKNQLIARGWCHKHYKRWQTYGDPTYVKNPRIHDMSLEERILDTIKVEGRCWIWQGSISKRSGRPRLKYQGKTTTAHRASFIAFKRRIPEGLFVLHTCDNILCVNPDHLYAGTHLDNMRDRNIRTGFKNLKRGVSHHNAKLSDIEVMSIFNSEESNYALATKYGIANQTVSGIKTGKQKSWLTGKVYSGRKRGMV